MNAAPLMKRYSSMSAPSLTLNGAPTPLTAPLTLAELLAAQGITPEQQGIAVARNGAVVPRAQWAHTSLAADDRIEVVTMLQGG